MSKLKLKSFQYALPYMLLCLVFVIVEWNLCMEIVGSWRAGILPPLSDDVQIKFLATIICFGILIVFLVLIISGKCQRDVYKYIQNSTSPELAKEKVEKFLKEAPCIYNLQYSKDFLCCRNCIFTVFLHTGDVVRIAKRTKIHRYKILIPICKFNYLDIVTADGRKRCITFNREKQLDEAMMAIRSIWKKETNY